MKNSLTVTSEQPSLAGTPRKKPGFFSLVKLTVWVDKLNFPFIVTFFGITAVLLWAGAYKLTAPGAEGIVPLVSNSPLMGWLYSIFDTYLVSDLIGITEIASGLLIVSGLFYPKSGILGSLIAVVIFSVTSTLVITTPGTMIIVNEASYLTFLGLFLFKDVISLGAAFYLLSHFRNKAIPETSNF